MYMADGLHYCDIVLSLISTLSPSCFILLGVPLTLFYLSIELSIRLIVLLITPLTLLIVMVVLVVLQSLLLLLMFSLLILLLPMSFLKLHYDLVRLFCLLLFRAINSVRFFTFFLFVDLGK